MTAPTDVELLVDDLTVEEIEAAGTPVWDELVAEVERLRALTTIAGLMRAVLPPAAQ